METMIKEIHHFFNGFKKTLSSVAPEYAIHISRFPRDAIWAIQQYANTVPSEASLRVYAVGGDGILFDCLNGIIELPNAELGFIPCGKNNDFLWTFNVKNKNIMNSLEAQTYAPSVLMDVLYCGSNYALSHCLVGLEAFSNKNTKKSRGKSTFLDRGISAFFRMLNINPMHFTSIFRSELLKQNYHVWLDNENLSGKYAFINISNNLFSESSKNQALWETDLSDGYLDVLACGEMSVLESYSVLNNYANGGHAKHPNLFKHRQAKKVFLSSSHPLILDLDGEIFYDKYISVEIKPKKVRIIVPGHMS
jgi:diacylglycerol kinase family enzyme